MPVAFAMVHMVIKEIKAHLEVWPHTTIKTILWNIINKINSPLTLQ